MFRLGLIINPLAGVGGPLGRKGSDDLPANIAAPGTRAQQRVERALTEIARRIGADDLTVYGFDGTMGNAALDGIDLPFCSVGETPVQSTRDDTVRAARCLREAAVDLILFAGGDGTARDIYRAVGSDFPVLGLPAGVKMQSGVFAVSPAAAAEILLAMMAGELVDVAPAEVRDIDEEAYRAGSVRSRFFGDLLVPRKGNFLQNTKVGGREVEELVVEEIATAVIESMESDGLYIVGPGTTPRGILQHLGLEGTLLGFDAIRGEQLIAADLNEQQMLALIVEQRANHNGPVRIVITATGGQGYLLGRGNQQLSAEVIRASGIESLVIIATKTKLTELAGRPLLVDTNDVVLDQDLCGFRKVITGYQDAVLYQLSTG